MDVTADPATILRQGRGVAGALKAISTKRGRSFSMETKPGRFEIQKTVYLLKRLGVPSAQKYEYNIYLNGPYSPDLAEVYYTYKDDGLRSATTSNEVSPQSYGIVSEALTRSPEFLEGLTTVIDGIASAGDLPRALVWAQSIKPHIDGPTWAEVKAFLAKHPSLI